MCVLEGGWVFQAETLETVEADVGQQDNGEREPRCRQQFEPACVANI
jgi:hypothetical protein